MVKSKTEALFVKVTAILTCLVYISWLVFVMWLNYPPSYQQISLIATLGENGLIILRISSAIITAISIAFLSHNFKPVEKWIFRLLAVSIPTLHIVYITSPFTCLSLFLFSLCVRYSKRKSQKAIGIVLLTISLYIINIHILKQIPEIYQSNRQSKVQLEITERFTKEDTTKNHVEFPLWFRRIGYNKYYLITQNIALTTLKYFNFEILFFQEVYPSSQKSTILLYWPLYIVFVISLISIKRISDILYPFVISIICYLFCNTTPNEQYLIPAMVFLMLISLSVGDISKKIRHTYIVFILVLTICSNISAINDMFHRPFYWMDNKPIVYQSIYSFIKSVDTSKYNTITVSSIVGKASEYCLYYIGNCHNFNFDNFNLSQDVYEKNNLYVGFIGNIVGPHTDNNFNMGEIEHFNKINNTKIIYTYDINDTIANKYGNTIIGITSNE